MVRGNQDEKLWQRNIIQDERGLYGMMRVHHTCHNLITTTIERKLFTSRCHGSKIFG